MADISAREHDELVHESAGLPRTGNHAPAELGGVADATHRMTRRQVLAAGASSALAAGILVGCGGATSASSTAASGGGGPKRGGTLRVGMITGGTAELVIPSSGSYPDFLRTNLLYDPLFQLGNDLKTLVPMLATAAEPTHSAKVWTFTLRSGVTWHNGKPFTADDVVWTD